MTEQEIDRLVALSFLPPHFHDQEDLIASLEKLLQSVRKGHLCIDRSSIGEAIDCLPSSLLEDGATLFPQAPIIRNGKWYYLQKNWVYETYLLLLTKRLRMQKAPLYFKRDKLEELLKKSCISGELLPLQAQAIRSSLQNSLSLICGGPGTGKTYTASYLVKLLFLSRDEKEKPELRLSLLAPTGKAAFHLRSSLESQGVVDPALKIEAMTLHRQLKLQPGMQRLFSKRRLDADLVIVDEASMIDISLLAQLFESIGEDTLLILIGDPDQLPPIEAASPFREMSSLFATHLQQCIRTEIPRLQELAVAVKKQDRPAFFENIEPLFLSWPFDASLSERLFEWMQPLVLNTSPDPQKAMEKYADVRILNAMRQGPFGTDRLNAEIFQKLQRQKGWWAAPILVCANDPYADLYNGMGGILVGKNLEEPIAYFPDPSSGEMRRFSSPPLYELAFCLSIHKSQGSEFSNVLALFPEGSEHFGRECLYTAITRAKKSLQLLARRESLEQMWNENPLNSSNFLERYPETPLISRQAIQSSS